MMPGFSEAEKGLRVTGGALIAKKNLGLWLMFIWPRIGLESPFRGLLPTLSELVFRLRVSKL